MTGRLALLAAALRAGGVRVGIGDLLSAHRALAAVDPSDRAAAYFALRSTLCSRHEDLGPFDAAFAEWFGVRRPEHSEAPPLLDEVAALVLPSVAVPAAEQAVPQGLERAAHATQDWSGGTRIGEALATLNREHGRRLVRGAAIVLLSDGWDRGEPEQLEREMARLSRCSHSLIWLNPLKAHPDYEPLTRGMRVALPHVDHFLAGNCLASLQGLASTLDSLTGDDSNRLRRGRLRKEDLER